MSLHGIDQHHHTNWHTIHKAVSRLKTINSRVVQATIVMSAISQRPLQVQLHKKVNLDSLADKDV